MAIKSAQQLVQEAYSEVKTINTDQALTLVKENKCNLIDIRDVRELEKEGKLDLDKEMVLFCAAGSRSALAAKALQDMGFEKVSHVEGGFGAIKQSDFKII